MGIIYFSLNLNWKLAVKNNNNNNNGSFYYLSDKDLQGSTVHWFKIFNLFAIFSFLSLNSIQKSLHIRDGTFLVSLSKTTPY